MANVKIGGKVFDDNRKMVVGREIIEGPVIGLNTDLEH